MIDFPMHDVQVVQEYVVNESNTSQLLNENSYEISEMDLSFCDALAGMCSGSASSYNDTRVMVPNEKKTG